MLEQTTDDLLGDEDALLDELAPDSGGIDAVNKDVEFMDRYHIDENIMFTIFTATVSYFRLTVLSLIFIDETKYIRPKVVILYIVMFIVNRLTSLSSHVMYTTLEMIVSFIMTTVLLKILTPTTDMRVGEEDKAEVARDKLNATFSDTSEDVLEKELIQMLETIEDANVEQQKTGVVEFSLEKEDPLEEGADDLVRELMEGLLDDFSPKDNNINISKCNQAFESFKSVNSILQTYV